MRNNIGTETGATVAVVVALALMSKDDIKAGQDVISSNLSNLDKAIHDNAIQCMLHAEKHGDTSLMRRLLMDVLDAKKTGYRVQGLINWMRTFSPMELKGKDINLSGTDEKGVKRPFLIGEANNTPFWTDRRNDEALKFKPVFQQTALAKVDSFIKEIEAAVENTVNGQPVDPKKPYYDGLHADVMVDFAEFVKSKRNLLPDDKTLEVRKAQAEQRRLGDFIDANKDNVAPMAAVA